MSWLTGMPSSVAASLTGLGVVRLASPPPAVGPGHAERDVVPRRDEGAQRRHGHLRRAEIREAGHPVTVGQAAAPRLRPPSLSPAPSVPRRATSAREEVGQPVGIRRARSSVRLRRILSASLRWSSLSRSTSRMPSRWSSSCWNTRPSSSVASIGDFVAVEVEADQVDGVGPHDLPAEPGHRQAALVVDPLAVALDDPRVDDGAGALARRRRRRSVAARRPGWPPARFRGRRTSSRSWNRPGWPPRRRCPRRHGCAP